MSKTLLILHREVALRLRRPAFWVVTLMVPLLLAALYALPVVAASRAEEEATVLVVDETGLFEHSLRPADGVDFRAMPSLDYARRQMESDRSVAAILFVPMRETTIPRDAFLYHRSSRPPLKLQSLIDSQMQTLLRNAILEDVYQVEPSVYHSVESTYIKLRTRDAATGRESFAAVKSAVATVLAVLMVLALIVFGVQVMRAVQEEKSTRVAEVMAATVRPTQLMVGKVGGVALTAVLQLTLWALLTTLAVRGIQASAPELFAQAREQQQARTLASKGSDATAQYNTTVTLVDETVQGLTAIRLPLVAGVFLLFFLLGYLLYGALLAALAARLDGDADALQWVLLVMSPLLAAMMLTPLALQAPAGGLAAWLSLVPFSAPVGVMLRLPFGIATWQLLLSALLLLLLFAAAAWWAARVYRRHLVR
ncbi:MAG: ABC transporter permease [Bacteroidales bacterium]|nr:ABC transporter permease [Bacteroidales bacterium]